VIFFKPSNSLKKIRRAPPTEFSSHTWNPHQKTKTLSSILHFYNKKLYFFLKNLNRKTWR